MTKQFDRTPPQNLEAERSVLGAMLLNPDAVGTAVEILRENAEVVFFHQSHQFVYEAMVNLFAVGLPIDAVTLMEFMERAGTLDVAGGASYLAELTRVVPTSANVAQYAKAVLACAVRRHIISAGTRLVQEAATGETDSAEMLERADQAIYELVAMRQTAGGVRHISEGLHDAGHALRQRSKPEFRIEGLPCGFAKLDELSNGFAPKEVVVVAARPSVGKTAFMLNVVRNMAVDRDIPCLVFNMEMARHALQRRLIQTQGHIDLSRLDESVIGKMEQAKIATAEAAIQKAPIYIDDTRGLTMMDIRSRVRQAKKRRGIQFVAIDYLGLIRAKMRSNQSRQQVVAEISRSIHELAGELDIAIMELSQVNREVEKEKRMLRLSDLRESGDIEQDADKVWFLNRDPAHPQSTNLLLDQAKYRNGPTGVVKLTFDRWRQTFKDEGEYERPVQDELPQYDEDPEEAF